MKVKFFCIQAQYPNEGEDALNAFCSSHKVTTLEKQFVALGADIACDHPTRAKTP